MSSSVLQALSSLQLAWSACFLPLEKQGRQETLLSPASLLHMLTREVGEGQIPKDDASV